jgi:uncharacterized protein with PIN domain
MFAYDMIFSMQDTIERVTDADMLNPKNRCAECRKQIDSLSLKCSYFSPSLSRDTIVYFCDMTCFDACTKAFIDGQEQIQESIARRKKRMGKLSVCPVCYNAMDAGSKNLFCLDCQSQGLN